MRNRGQGLLAAAVAIGVVGGGIVLGRVVEPRARPAAGAGEAASRAWICPHGGGGGWRATVFLANPSDRLATALVTSITGDDPSPTRRLDVPPTSTVRVDVPAAGREASTFVETFGPWVAAGWVVKGAGPERGMGAEPCAPSGDRTWFVADGTTEEGEEAFVIVSNPYRVDAVVDVAMFAEGRAPIRDSRLTNLFVPARASVAVRLGRFAAGEPAVGTLVQARVGRVGVAGLGVGASGIVSTIGRTATAERVVLPFSSGSGQASLQLFGPGERASALGATLLTDGEPALLGDLVDAELDPGSAAAFPLVLDGPSAVELSVQGSAGVSAALRAAGTQGDAAAASGAAAPATAWVVLPATDAGASVPGAPPAAVVVLVNPTESPADVNLQMLSADGGAPTVQTLAIASRTVATFTLPPTATSVVVRCEAGEVVAMGAAASGTGDAQGPAGYALSMGVPLER